MTFSRDGAQLLVGFPDGAVRIYGLKSGKILKELHGHTAIVNDIHYSADGASIFTGSADGTIRVWSHQTAQCIKVGCFSTSNYRALCIGFTVSSLRSFLVGA